jgi:hypothetical protein
VVLLVSTTGAARLGDADNVVAWVVAVGGLSSDTRDMAATEVAGILPVSSNRWMRSLRSSSSSQTVEAGAVEADDSVPSTAWFVSGAC